MFGSRLGLVAMICVLLGAAVAYAEPTSPTGTVMLRYSSCSPRQAATVSVKSGAWLTGKYNLQLDTSYNPDGGEFGTGEGEDIYAAAQSTSYYIGTFCSDVWQYAPSDYLVYDVYRPADAPIGGANPDDGMGDAKAADLRKLFGNYSGSIGYKVTHNSVTYSVNDVAAAFQAAVWEIVYETNDTYNARNDTSTSDDFWMDEYWQDEPWLDLANYWLGTLSGLDDPDLGLRVLANIDTQDYAFVVPGLGGEPIPEPLTMLGVFLSVSALTGYIRKRRAA